MRTDYPGVATGLDVLNGAQFAPIRGRRVGAICNPTSVDHRMRHLADLLQHARDGKLVALFGPEHGIRGDAQDLIGVESRVDPGIGVPIHSLYGADVASLTPTADQLEGIDLLIFDVHDVGSRYYTFAATMLYAMKAAAASGIAFLVLDRPNPIGGVAIEGPTIQAGFESFIGAHPIPIRHGLTIGELAQMYRSELGLDLDLAVIPCQGWRRSMLWSETGLRWVMPSPNMPTPETALVYPGGCLIEGTNLSEGRGTTRPFELWGAPWLDPKRISEIKPDPSGAILRPCAFRPMFHKHAGQVCFGVQPHPIDPWAFEPVKLFMVLIANARNQDPERFVWRTEPYEFVRDPIAIDLLFGSARERQFIESEGISDGPRTRDNWHSLFATWRRDEDEFRDRRAPYLLYD